MNIFERQVTKLIEVINQIGKSTYRQHKAALGIELDKPIPQLTKQRRHGFRLITSSTAIRRPPDDYGK